MELDTPVTACLAGLSSTALLLHLYLRPSSSTTSSTSSTSTAPSTSSLTRIYLPAHLLALFSDWLQGPYVFQLYRHHGHPDGSIAILFLAGYLSSCFLGSFSGPLADKYGRRRLGQVFCVVCAINCLLKVFPSFHILLLGRVLSGLSTSCLYSVFESWYVAEHQGAGLPQEALSSTLALVTTCNSLLAILAGLMADLLVQTLGLGPVAPFIAAVPCLLGGLLVISCCWGENYGERRGSLGETYIQGASLIWASPQILRLGAVQALMEASMFIFVYLWTPTLTSGGLSIPLGRVFAAFMVSIMVGSFLFRLLSPSVRPHSTLLLSTLLFLLSSLLASLLATSPSPYAKLGCLGAFILIEISLGLYFPSIGTLRSLALPGSHRSTIINLFRVPLNLLTAATLLAVRAGHLGDRSMVFGLVSCYLALAALVAASLRTAEEGGKGKQK